MLNVKNIMVSAGANGARVYGIFERWSGEMENPTPQFSIAPFIFHPPPFSLDEPYREKGLLSPALSSRGGEGEGPRAIAAPRSTSLAPRGTSGERVGERGCSWVHGCAFKNVEGPQEPGTESRPHPLHESAPCAGKSRKIVVAAGVSSAIFRAPFAFQGKAGHIFYTKCRPLIN